MNETRELSTAAGTAAALTGREPSDSGYRPERKKSQANMETSASAGGVMERTISDVGEEIRNLTAAAKYLTLWYAVEIGRRLTEAKELVPHGGWLDWLKSETEFSQPSASRFMKLYSEYGADQKSLFGAETKYSTLNNLSVSNALRLLAVPAEEREEFAAEVDAEHISSRELEEAIRARDEALKQAAVYKDDLESTQAALNSLDNENDDLRAKIKELESRPVDVAVEKADPAEIEKAVAEAVGKANADHAAELDKLKKKLEKAEKNAEKAEKAAKDAEAKAEAAGKDTGGEVDALRAEAERLKAEAEGLRKALAVSGDKELATFELLFEQAQEAVNKLLVLLGAARSRGDGERAEKLQKALLALAEGVKGAAQ